MKLYQFVAAMLFTISVQAAEDKIELDTTRIKANQELPQILYVVPWKDIENSKGEEQKLVLHDFFGDLYDPVLPSELSTDNRLIRGND